MKTAIASGLDVDSSPGVSFFWAIRMNFYLEVARCAQPALVVPHRREPAPEPKRGLMLRTPARHRAGRSCEAGPYKQHRGTTIEGHGCRVWRHPKPTRKYARQAIRCCPPKFSSRIARNTQLIIQEETHITNVVDPGVNGYMMEKLTQEWRMPPGPSSGKSSHGRHGAAVDSSWAKLKIEAAA